MKLFDKIASHFGYIHKQQASRHARSFAAAQIDRLTSDWMGSRASVDQAVFRSLPMMVARSRELAMNNDYVRKFLKLCQANVVGATGITLQMRVQDPNGKPDSGANRLIEEAFDRWRKKGVCDVTGKLSFADLEKLVIQSVARDGEVLIRKVRNFPNEFRFALQVIEADHLDVNYSADLGNGNYIRMGVEFNEWGRPVAYHLLTKHPGDHLAYAANKKPRERIPADEIVHLFVSDRPGQSRGYPWIHAAMIRLNMLGGYEEAELTAARLGACKMGFFERSEDGGEYTGDDVTADGDLLMEAEPGIFEQLPPGVKLHEYNPQHPAGNFPAFVKNILRGVASGINISYNSLASDLEGVNYSSLRAGFLEERDGWMVIQRWFFENFHDAFFPDWLQYAMLTGQVSLPFSKFDKFNAPFWMPRRWPWVDPLKDMQANLLAVRMGAKDLSDVILETGKDPDEVFEGIAKTKAQLEKLGLGGISNFLYEKTEGLASVEKDDKKN